MTESYKFITFGCWNDYNSYFPIASNVLNSVKQYCINNTDCKFIIITGDNYYSNKIKPKNNSKKQKILNVEKLKEGFDELPTNIPIYLLLGNHDLDNGITGIASQDISETSMSTNSNSYECITIQKEYELINATDNIKKPNKLTMYNVENKTLFIMIDTTIYDIYNEIYANNSEKTEESIKKEQKYIKCYSFLEKGLDNIENIMNLQKMEVLKILDNFNKEEINNVVISGHHPLVETRVDKKDKSKYKTSHLINSYDLLHEIYNKFDNSVKYYYLCADYHCYQYGDIIINLKNSNETMNIKQYIVGTGGAELDKTITIDHNYIDTYNSDIYNIDYKVNRTSPNHGFLVCSSDKDANLSFEFNKVSNALTVLSGGKNKSKKRKIYRNKTKTRKMNKK